MNNVTPEKKEAVLKTLAIAGFIGIIIFIAWASVQLVSVVPSAFNSLASLAEGVNQYRESNDTEAEVGTIVVSSNTLLAQTGDTVTLNWNTAQAPGSYVFQYQCADGVAIDILNIAGLQSIQCETNYNLGNVDSLTLSVDSVKNRYADLNYSIAFLGTNDTRPRASGEASLTVINNDLTDQVVIEDETPVTEPTESPAEQPETPITPAAPTTPSTPTPTTPEYIQEFVYTIPTSDPNGKTDLATRYLFVGEIKDNRFEPGALQEREDGAIQFEVKNFGTKTSDRWTFSVSLPGGGTYESTRQAPLKPNERAVLTVGFIGADVQSHTFKVEVEVDEDRNRSNNEFSQRVPFRD